MGKPISCVWFSTNRVRFSTEMGEFSTWPGARWARMRTEDRPRQAEEVSPGEAAYRELAEEQADRVYGLVMLLLGDPAVAHEITVQAFERTWDGIRRDTLLGDPIETLYWTATRAA